MIEPQTYEPRAYNRYLSTLSNVTGVIGQPVCYPFNIMNASGYARRAFIDWLHEQDGYNCDRDYVLRFMEQPYKWQPEWEKFIKEKEVA